MLCGYANATVEVHVELIQKDSKEEQLPIVDVFLKQHCNPDQLLQI